MATPVQAVADVTVTGERLRVLAEQFPELLQASARLFPLRGGPGGAVKRDLETGVLEAPYPRQILRVRAGGAANFRWLLARDRPHRLGRTKSQIVQEPVYRRHIVECGQIGVVGRRIQADEVRAQAPAVEPGIHIHQAFS